MTADSAAHAITSELAGQTALITGAAHGQGRATALALAREGVNIDMISTSEIKISVVVDLAKGEQAMKAIHAAFLPA